MADTCAIDQEDLLGDKLASVLLWGLPQVKPPVFFPLRAGRWPRWRREVGRLWGGVALLISLSACAPQSSGPATPTWAEPTATAIQGTPPTPAAASPSTLSPGHRTKLGFNVRGWT